MSGSRLRTPSTEEVNNVAVIAAWCESPAHLAPAPVDAYLSDSGHRALCTVVATRWDPCNPTRSQDLEGVLEGQVAEDAGAHHSGSSRHLSAEELSQRSVDLLLRSYYQMVKDNHRKAGGSKGAAAGPNALQKAFLLICRPLPLNLRTLFKAGSAVVVAVSYLLAVLSFIFVPLWLALIRHFAASGLWRQAAAVAVYGLLAFLAADFIYRSRETERRRRRRGAVTPANVATVLQDAARSYYEAPFAPSAANGPSHNPAAHIPAITGNSGRGGADSSGSALSRLRPDLEALQKSVYGSKATGVPADLSEAGVEAELRKICGTIGVEFKQGMTGSADALAKAVKDLKRDLGV